MRLTLPQQELAAAAQWAAKQLPNQPLYPVLMGLRLEAEGDSLSLSAFDGDTATRSRLDADVDDGGSLLVSARLLADVLSTLGKTDITLDASDGEHLTVSTVGATVQLPTLNSHDYPTLPAVPETVGTVDGAELAAAYKRIRCSVDPKADGELAGISGVRIRINGDRVQLTTTDRYRISDAWLPLHGEAAASAVAVLPEKVLANNIPALADSDVQLALPANGGIAGLVGGGRQVVTSVYDPATFPGRIDAVVPKEFTGTAIFDAAEMADALRRVAVVVEPGKPIWLHFDRDTATLRARDHGSATATLDAAYDGDSDHFEAAWNATYLGDGLANLDGAIHMGLTTPKRPALLHNPDDDTYRYTVVPIQCPERNS